jgi:hypothetical protein
VIYPNQVSVANVNGESHFDRLKPNKAQAGVDVLTQFNMQ